MKKLLLFLLLLVVLLGCASGNKPTQDASMIASSEGYYRNLQLDRLAERISNGVKDNTNKKIAVMAFSQLDGSVNNLGKFIAEELTLRFFQNPKFNVIERQLIDKILAEQTLGISGTIDDESAARLGKVLGADAIISGTITDLGYNVKLNARMLASENGSVISVASVEIKKTETIARLLGESTQKNIAKKKAKKTRAIKKNGFVIELEEAKMEFGQIVCKLKVTNQNREDKDFIVGLGWQYKTMVFDDLGNEYVISMIKSGNKEVKIKGISQYEGMKKRVISDSSIPVELIFDNVDANASKINLLQILLGDRGPTGEFKNIPLQVK